jgi:ATP-dependent DNA helicase DinG
MKARPVSAPAAPVAKSARRIIVAGFSEALIVDADGTAARRAHADAVAWLADGPAPLVCHATGMARRLGCDRFPALDVLELFAFVRPARFCLPTVDGLALALGLARPKTLEDEAGCLGAAADVLLAELGTGGNGGTSGKGGIDAHARPIAESMRRGGWTWGDAVLAALPAPPAGTGDGANHVSAALGGLDVWRRLPEWSEYAPEPQPGDHPVEAAEARARLAVLIGHGAEARPQQSDYASAVSAAFAPRENEGEPNFVIAEAGTGVGKTLGYIAPASLWAEKNDGPVWISTFTRNLQRQIDGELDRLFIDAETKARRVVIRKGRENYLCLLNMQEAAGRIATGGTSAVALGLMARWAAQTRSGDVVGGDFPTWLADLVGFRDTLGLTDRRGECIYSSCDHYRRCFIERTVRQARRADIVVANHALVMAQAALGGLDDNFRPTRLVFDEGHHIFAAADSAFSAELSGRRGAELRHWLLGAENARRSRARGLAGRIKDIAATDDAAGEALDQVMAAARTLPGPGWQERIDEGEPRGPAEAFLARVRAQVYGRNADAGSPYDLECTTEPLADGLAGAAATLETALGALANPMKALTARLARLLDDKASELDTSLRQRIEATSRGLRRRTENEVEAWRAMLQALAIEAPGEFVDWFSVSRDQGRDTDCAMHRHWIDPTIPFAAVVAQPAHGVLVTSATLRDGSGDTETDWHAAEAATGALHLQRPAIRAEVPSPFDYREQTRVIVVTDVDRSNGAQVAAAYRELFMAANGGALGLFTAIARLRHVHGKIAQPLEAAGLRLYAQHVDSLDTASLVDIFRTDEDSCLLGTDAVRDGVDVPGRALRLVVFDRVPWPRPTILHRARRKAHSGKGYDDMIARLRLKQAYGRLVRKADDWGVFVMLDRGTPSRLAGAFPDGVEIRRLGLKDAIELTGEFLNK